MEYFSDKAAKDFKQTKNLAKIAGNRKKIYLIFLAVSKRVMMKTGHELIVVTSPLGTWCDFTLTFLLHLSSFSTSPMNLPSSKKFVKNEFICCLWATEQFLNSNSVLNHLGCAKQWLKES